MKGRTAGLVLAACLVWSGCGQPEDRTPGGTDGPGAPLTVEEFGAELDEEFAEVLCRGAFECPGQIDPTTVALLRRSKRCPTSSSSYFSRTSFSRMNAPGK